MAVVSRSGYDAITRDGRLIETLSAYGLIFVYSVRSRHFPPFDLGRELHVIEMRNAEAYVSSLLAAVHQRYPLTRVISISEQDFILAAHAREALGLPGLSVAEATRYRDKVDMKSHLQPDIRHPAFLVTSLWDEVDAFLRAHGRIIVKPRRGAGSQDCHVITGADELEKCRQQIGNQLVNYFAEVYIDMPVYHLDALVRGGALRFATLGIYSHPPLQFAQSDWLTTISTNAPSRLYNHATSLLMKVLSSYGTHDGVFHLEFFASGDTVYFGEIAIRPAGGGIPETIYQAWGVHLFEEHVRIQLGLPPESSTVVTSGSDAKWAATMLYLPAKGGVLRRLRLEQVRSHPCVRSVSPHVSEGQRIAGARYSADCLFTVNIVADDRTQLESAIDDVKAMPVAMIE